MVVVMQKFIQCVVVGDGFVGKLSLVQKFVNGKFDKIYIVILKDDYSVKVFINGDVFRLNVFDIVGEVSRFLENGVVQFIIFLEMYYVLFYYFYCLFFVLQYEDLFFIVIFDIFIVCFSLVDDDFMDSVLNFWIFKIWVIVKYLFIILVGIQFDLR